LRRLDILRRVQVLVLDGLTVTSDLVSDILIDPSYSVRILSLRECKHLNERKLRGALQYACRASRPEGTPRLKGLYIFGKKDRSELQPPPLDWTAPTPPAAAVGVAWNARSRQALTGANPPSGADDPGPEPWYGRRGRQFPMPNINSEWASTLVACDGIVAFDAVLCTGPRHPNSAAWGKVNLAPLGSPIHWGVAEYSLGGCAGCGSAPEGWTVWGDHVKEEAGDRERSERRDSDGCGAVSKEIGRFPLLRQAPMHSANVKVAMCPSNQPLNPHWMASAAADGAGEVRFIPRCMPCIRDRYCTACHRWWCESCYTGPPISRPSDGPAVQTNSGADAASEPPGTNGANATGDDAPKQKVRDGYCYLDGGCWYTRSDWAS